MTPERMAEVVAWWVRRYTRNLPPPIAERRIERSTAQRSALRVALVTVSVLLVPLVAMQFSDEVAWSAADFIFAGSR